MWDNDMLSREANRANQRKWCRAVRSLGDKWLLAAPVGRTA